MEVGHKAKSQFMPKLALKVLSQLHDPLNSDFGLVWHYFKVWNYTESLNMLGRYEEALAYLQSIPLEFYNPIIPELLIEVYVKLGKSRQEVEALVEHFSQSDEQLYATYYTAAAYEFGLVAENETSQYFARKAAMLMHTSPGKKARTYDLVDALYLSNDFTGAKTYLKQKLEEDTDNEDFLVYLALVEAALGQATEAEKIFAPLESHSLIFWRRHEYEYQTDYLKARIYALLGKKAEAVALLKDALAQGQLRHHWDFERDIFLKTLFDYPPFQAIVKPKDSLISQ